MRRDIEDGASEDAAVCADLEHPEKADNLTAYLTTEEAVLLDVGAVAAMLACSERSVWRLADGGKMPPPVRIGRIVRWRRSDIMGWIEAGCPSERKR